MPKSMKKLPTQAILRELFDYEPLTGNLRWRVNRGTARAGAVAGTPHVDGYVSICVDRRRYLAHRLIWAWMRGDVPDGAEIDHDNGVRNDNRWDNLFLTTHKGNMMNSKLRSDNKSGVNGVRWHKKCRKWRVVIGRKHIGLFTQLGAAIAAREAANEKYGYHETHGAHAWQRNIWRRNCAAE